MAILICSNIFGDFNTVSDLTRPINSSFATANKCDYIIDNERRCTDDSKSFWWEKIAFLRSVFSKRAEGDTIVWLDVDSLIQKDANIQEILPPNKNFGMVPIYAGLGGRVKKNWYNAGVIVMKNVAEVRNLIESVWQRRNIDQDDEVAIAAELPKSKVNFAELDPKWNCWNNNKHLVDKPSIITFHGIYPTSAKVSAIKLALDKLK